MHQKWIVDGAWMKKQYDDHCPFDQTNNSIEIITAVESESH